MSYLRDNFKFLIKDSFLYGLVGALSRLSALITMPILTRYLTKSEYGTFDLVTSFAVIFNAFIVFGQDSAIARFFFEKGKIGNVKYQKTIATTGLSIQIICLLLVFGILTFSYKWIGLHLFDDNPTILPYWKIALFSIPGSIFVLYTINLLKWTLNRSAYFILSMFSVILNIILIVLFVKYLNLKIFGALYAIVISNTLAGFAGLVINRKYISFRLFFNNLQFVKPMLYFSIPLVASAVISAILPNLDKLFLINNLTTSELATYAVAKRFASLLLVITTSFTIAFGPFSLSRWHEENARFLFSRIATYYILVLVVITVCISYFSGLLISLLATQEYLLGSSIIPILSLTIIVQALFDFTYMGFSYSKKMHYIFILLFINFSLSCVFLYFLVPVLGMWGAALSILLSETIKISLSYKISKNLFFIPFEFKSILVILAASLPLFSIVTIEHLFEDYNKLLFVLKTLFLVLFLIIIYFKLLHQHMGSFISLITHKKQ